MSPSRGPEPAGGRPRGRSFENMITVTRLDERVVVINAELIKMIESTPDTIITLINGDSIIVRESVDEVVRLSVDYARQIRGLQVV